MHADLVAASEGTQPYTLLDAEPCAAKSQTHAQCAWDHQTQACVANTLRLITHVCVSACPETPPLLRNTSGTASWAHTHRLPCSQDQWTHMDRHTGPHKPQIQFPAEAPRSLSSSCLQVPIFQARKTPKEAHGSPAAMLPPPWGRESPQTQEWIPRAPSSLHCAHPMDPRYLISP